MARCGTYPLRSDLGTGENILRTGDVMPSAISTDEGER